MKNEKTPTLTALLDGIDLGLEFHTSSPRLAQVWQYRPNDYEGVTCNLWTAEDDIYDALECFGDIGEPDTYALAAVTLGWAAPISQDGGDDLLPSAHPARRRVVVIALRCADGRTASRIHFRDTGEVIEDLEGEAHGSMADALASALNYARLNYATLEETADAHSITYWDRHPASNLEAVLAEILEGGSK